MRLAAYLCLCLVALPAAAAAPAWLIATPDETARAGAPIMLDIVKPAAQADWPDTLRLRLVRDDRALEVELAIVDPVLTEDTRRTYRGVLPAHLSGLVRAHLAGAESNRLALVVTAADPIERMRAPMYSDATPVTRSSGTGSKLFAADEPALSANEPMYFVVGGGGGATARFQLSFKYRLFDPDSHPVQWIPFLSRLHFGYTQTSIWDLGANSSPFRDTSYRPSLFWQGETHGESRLMPEVLRAGFEHESNGKDGVSSRSINTLFAQPVWRSGFLDGRTLIFAPKVYGYLENQTTRTSSATGVTRTGFSAMAARTAGFWQRSCATVPQGMAAPSSIFPTRYANRFSPARAASCTSSYSRGTVKAARLQSGPWTQVRVGFQLSDNEGET